VFNLRDMKTVHTQLNEMKIGEKIKLDIWDVWRMPTGWVMAIDGGVAFSTSVFVPDVLNVESHVTNHY
jgi:hypothetical protein